jgi:Putative transposase/Transposase zinc-binding domain
MCKLQDERHTASNDTDNGESKDQYSDIGALFRAYKEEYIKIYKPQKHEIKFIKDVSKCKTQAMGGMMISCKSCDHKTFIYKSCGNGQCPICQSIKRIQWQDKLASKMLKCPYQHIIFTIPHELNYIAKRHPRLVYGVLFKAAWQTIGKLAKDDTNLGGTPGMTAVLHTFGSDLKHHIHLHTLVTFGGVSKEGKWVWPKRKNKIAPYRKMRREFKILFLKELEQQLQKKEAEYYAKVKVQINATKVVSWCVHNTPPTAHTKVIEEYLGRYVCRVGVSNKKLQYDKANQQVMLEYNDYKNQKQNEAAPKAIKNMDPLAAMNQIMIHVLPPNFQKVRSYGIMTKTKQKEVKKNIPELVKENGQTIRTIFQIIKALLKLEDDEEIKCSQCGSSELEIEEVLPDEAWYDKHIRQKSRNKSPTDGIEMDKKDYFNTNWTGTSMSQIKEKKAS